MLFLSIFKAIISKWSTAMAYHKMSENLVNQETQLFKRRSFIPSNKPCNIDVTNNFVKISNPLDKECCNE